MIRSDRSGIQIQKRDIQILLGLFESRLASRDHLCQLYFDGRPDATQKRLQKLKNAGLIVDRPREPDQPAIYQLTKQGFELLTAHTSFAGYPPIGWTRLQRRLQVSDLKLKHELEVVGVKAALCAALCRRPGFKTLIFSTWPDLFKFKVRGRSKTNGPLKPDGYLHVSEKLPEGGFKDHRFFLEVDRSTESQRVLINKALDYLSHYKSGGFAASQRAAPSRYKEVPFRVLVICKSPQRRDNLALRLVYGKPSIRALVWLTTMEELISDPLGDIWMTPAMYRPWPEPKSKGTTPPKPTPISLFVSSAAAS